ncbi:hypothetical protein ACH42_03965 [Endozoicomonas sp. (ex Bugula neritina AB1)]|nr:hypothetical protein ACH42_03965 [Endozoicomonas sp. (ex Bugula neritina AB1)]
MRCHKFFCTIVLSCPLAWGDSPVNDFLFKPPLSLFPKTDLSLALEPPKDWLINPVYNELCVSPVTHSVVELQERFPNIAAYIESQPYLKNKNNGIKLTDVLLAILNDEQSYILTGLNNIDDRSQREHIFHFFFHDLELLQRVRELNEDTFRCFLDAYLNDRRVLDLVSAVASSNEYASAYPVEQKITFIAPTGDSGTFFAQQIAAMLTLRQNTGVYFSFLIPWLLCQDQILDALKNMLSAYPQEIESGGVNSGTMRIFLSSFVQNSGVNYLAGVQNRDELVNLRLAIENFFATGDSTTDDNDYKLAQCLLFLLTREPVQAEYFNTFHIRYFIGVLSIALAASAAPNFGQLRSSYIEWLMGLAQYPAIQQVLYQIAPSLSPTDLTEIMSMPLADLHVLWINPANVDEAIEGFLLLPQRMGLEGLHIEDNLVEYIVHRNYPTEGAGIRINGHSLSRHQRSASSVAYLLTRLDRVWKNRCSSGRGITLYPSTMLSQLLESDAIKRYLQEIYNQGGFNIHLAANLAASENNSSNEEVLRDLEAERMGLYPSEIKMQV